jgi:hypothetical protein
LFWNQTGESQLFGPDNIREAERQVEINVRGKLSVVCEGLMSEGSYLLGS